MAGCFVVLNHNITDKQQKELKEKLKIVELYFPSQSLKKELVEINPSKWLSNETLERLKEEIKSVLAEKDYLWVQTEYGLTCYLVQFAFKNGFKPIYSTTRRVFEEKKLSDEKIKREYLFEHVCFMPYRRF